MPRLSPVSQLALALAALAFSALGCGALDEVDSVLSTVDAEIALTEQAEAQPAATRTPRPPSTPRPTSNAPAPSGQGGSWTIMLYQNADDEVLEEDIFIDLNEAELIGSSDQVNIVSQFDRYDGAFDGDGDWTSTKRFYVTQDDDLRSVGSEELEDLGEVNMADGQTLTEFIVWAAQNYPADNYVLILSDHGAGWPGGWNDPTAEDNGPDRVALAQVFGDMLYLMEMDRAIDEARQQAGIERFEIIGFDACLMGHVEVMAAMRPHTRYVVASQELEPALGWAYAAFLGQLAANPEMTGADLAQAIVDSYINEDQRIINDDEREIFAGRTSIQSVIRSVSTDITLSAVDTDQLPALLAALDNLALTLNNAPAKQVARARTYAQTFDNIFGEDFPPSYIDLAHFAKLLGERVSDAEVRAAADELTRALQAAIIANKKGSQRPGATGLSIYFPDSDLFKNRYAGNRSYTAVANRFATDTLWDDFLAAHYTGNTLSRSGVPTLPPDIPDADIIAPGAGTLEIDPITQSDTFASVGNPVTLRTQIRGGDNLAYIYLFVGQLDATRNALLIADQDFVEGDSTADMEGIFYPQWENGTADIDFDWEPTLYAISDGATEVQVLLYPEDYGADADNASYSVDGQYTLASTGNTRFAQILFAGDGSMRAVYLYTNADGTGAVSEIVPRAGDTFTPIHYYYDLTTGELFSEPGDQTLTLTGPQSLEWFTIDAPAGEYEVGFIAEDFDGNYVEAYVDVTVR